MEQGFEAFAAFLHDRCLSFYSPSSISEYAASQWREIQKGGWMDPRRVSDAAVSSYCHTIGRGGLTAGARGKPRADKILPGLSESGEVVR